MSFVRKTALKNHGLAVAVALLVSIAGGARSLAFEAPLNRFETAIQKFEEEDAARLPAAGGVLFVGSSTFQHWHSLEDEFKDIHAINRGFGGSTIPEVNHYFERVVAKYRPSKIVFYAGTNDIADGHSGERVAKDFQAFLDLAHAKLPGVPVYFISMSVAPSRMQWLKEYREGNRLIKAKTASDKDLRFIDVTGVMVDGEGKLRADYFGPDNLHMNRKGYDAWVPVLKTALSRP